MSTTMRFGLTAVMCMIGIANVRPSNADEVPEKKSKEIPYRVKPNTPVRALVPPAPKVAEFSVVPIEELAKMPEVSLMPRLPVALSNPFSLGNPEVSRLEQQVAKIAHLNKDGFDGFVRAIVEHRRDLKGLPFFIGDDCKLQPTKGVIFERLVQQVPRPQTGTIFVSTEVRDAPFESDSLHIFYEHLRVIQSGGKKHDIPEFYAAKSHHPMAIAALMQVVGPEPEAEKLALAKYLSAVPHEAAVNAQLRLALHASERTVREAALVGLKVRREREYTADLLRAFDYPLPTVARNAADAIVQLQRDDLIPALIDILERPDPRLATSAVEAGRDVWTVRELVRINHLQNCLLCHAPSLDGNVPIAPFRHPSRLGAIPLANEPVGGFGGYGGFGGFGGGPSHPYFIRPDVTYLRQDFSLMLPVEDPGHWPHMQRFDFLVRTRPITKEQADARLLALIDRSSGAISPYHAAALDALRRLTKRDTEPTAKAWRKLMASR